MATSTGPDLSAAQLAVEALMDDTCQIRRPGAESAETVDPVTLRVTAAAATVVYEGRCLIGTESRAGAPVIELGGDQRGIAVYRILLPLLEAPELLIGDLVTCTSSRRDPGLSGRTLKVVEAVYKTMAVSRKAMLTLES